MITTLEIFKGCRMKIMRMLAVLSVSAFSLALSVDGMGNSVCVSDQEYDGKSYTLTYVYQSIDPSGATITAPAPNNEQWKSPLIQNTTGEVNYYVCLSMQPSQNYSTTITITITSPQNETLTFKWNNPRTGDPNTNPNITHVSKTPNFPKHCVRGQGTNVVSLMFGDNAGC